MFKRVELKLRCELTELELQARGASMADTVTSIDDARRQRKETAKKWGDVIGGLEERQRDLSRAIRTGVEERLVPCRVSFHDPREATKTIVRLDTGEVVEECAMTSEECQTRMFAAPDVSIEHPTTAQLEEFHGDGQDARTSGEILHEQLVGSHATLDAADQQLVAAAEEAAAELAVCYECNQAECVCVENGDRVIAQPTIAQAVAAHNAREAAGELPA